MNAGEENPEMQMRDVLLLKVKKCILEIEPSAEVFLFGSRARNDFNEFSDWDFLVLVDGEVTTARADRIRHSLYEIEWDTGEVISTIIKSRLVWNHPEYRAVPLRKSVEREGIML
jgi:predicted nucleotidyltransferase